ncbi:MULTISPECIES: hypothetical protein [unclassified Ensifer]|uniref:hypothetical protein n=1 Tax=unclassified Ensifer TaxID=2633371 RepID=UPI00111187BF|nr:MULTISPECIES: hypothetical protein [unclassified Ensifer]
MWLDPVIGGAAPPGNKAIVARNRETSGAGGGRSVALPTGHERETIVLSRGCDETDDGLPESWWIARHSIRSRLLFRKRSFTLTSTSKFNEGVFHE